LKNKNEDLKKMEDNLRKMKIEDDINLTRMKTSKWKTTPNKMEDQLKKMEDEPNNKKLKTTSRTILKNQP
jgi:hypothetical protein